MGDPGQRRLDSSIGGLAGERPLAEGSHESIPGDRRGRATAKSALDPGARGLEYGHRDDEDHDREQWQVEAKERSTGQVDGKQHADQGDGDHQYHGGR